MWMQGSFHPFSYPGNQVSHLAAPNQFGGERYACNEGGMNWDGFCSTSICSGKQLEGSESWRKQHNLWGNMET